MRKVTAFLIFMVLLLAACRSEPERSAMAQSPTDGGTATAAAGSSGSLDLELRRLWSGSDFNFFASQPSPDGRWVTEIDWDTGDLAVRDLATGRLHRLTDKGPWTSSADYAEVGRFSSDGRRIAYSWFDDAGSTYQIRLLDFEVDEEGVPHGSEPRVVHPGGPQWAYWLYGWTEDDELLVGLYRPDNSTALGFLSLADGTMRVLKSFDWTDARADLSPDGRFIAYDHAPGPDPFERDIYIMSADGTTEAALVDGPGADRVLGWVPGDGSLLFHSERSGSPSIWRLPMQGGTPASEAELLREDVRNLEPLGFAGDTYYFGVQIEAPRHRTARIDFEDRRLVETPVTFDSPYGGNAVFRAIDWSPSGEHVAQEERLSTERTMILVRMPDGRVVEEWPLELRFLTSMLRWSPDGNSLFLPGRDIRGRSGFFELDRRSGELELVRHFDDETGRVFSISPDGERLYFTRINENAPDANERLTEIVALDLETRAEQVIHRVRYQGRQLGASHWSPLALTPDGGFVAYPEIVGETETRIHLLPVDGGTPRLLHRIPGNNRVVEVVGWEPDGAHLLVLLNSLSEIATSPEDGSDWSVLDVELHRIPRDGGEAVRIAEIRDYSGGARLHPDGRTLVYRAGRPRGEIWALEGLRVPAAATTEEGTSR